jgi:putative hemolysin
MGTTTTRVGWLLGRLSVVALVALVLIGLAVMPAEARTRDDGRNEANDFITWCIASGGDPVVVEASDERIQVRCDLPGGDILCNFYPSHWCHLWASRVVPGGISDVDIMPADQGDSPINRPVLAVPAGAGRVVLVEDGSAAGEAPAVGMPATFLAGSAAAIGDDAPPAAEAAAPVAEPVTEPVTESVGEPVAAPVANPVEGSIAAPVEEAAAEPIADAGTVARTAVVEEPAVAPAEDAVAEPVAAPGVQSVEAPAAAPVIESVAPVTEPVEAVAPVESQVDAPADEPSDK